MADIITLATYKSLAGINSPTKDVHHQMLVDFVNDFISKYCGTDFSFGTKTGVPVTALGNRILLPDLPISEVTKVTYNGTDLETTAYSLLDSDIGDLLIKSSYVSQTEFAYTVDYSYGFSTIPSAIKLAAYELVQYYDKEKHQGSKQLGNGQQVSYTSSRLLPPHIRNALDLYRRF